MSLFRILALITIPLFTAGCSSGPLAIHKIDVQQGNSLDPDTANKITIGMTADQVRFLLGQPLITDSFHTDRWDYLYYLKPGVGEVQKRRLTLFFANDEVSRIEKFDFPKDKGNVAAN